LSEARSGAARRLAKTSEGQAAHIEALIAPALEAMGYDIVRVLISGKERRVLQIMAERQSDGGMSVDDCSAVSRAVSAVLDVEDPISGSYTLEVSSAGLDRPLTRLADFARFAGFDARVELEAPRDGRKRFSGALRGLDGETVLLDTEEGEARLAFADIAKAKLLLNDKLLAAASAPGQGRNH